MQRVIIQMGMGVDDSGRDAALAAWRAVADAMNRAAVPLLAQLAPEHVRVAVSIGVPSPDAIDTAEIAGMIPASRVEVTCRDGGLTVQTPQSGASQIVANAAVEIFLEKTAAQRLAR